MEGAPSKKLAVVTGANKGIGLEICRQLASHGIKVILTARDERRGTAAVEKLKSSGLNVLFHQLDVADPLSVASFANFIKTHFGKLDILVNNAAVAGIIIDWRSVPSSQEEEDGYLKFMKIADASHETYESAKACLNINYYGMKRVAEALIPALQQAQSPRIVNVSSHYGQLSLIPSESIRKAMGEVDEKAEERIDKVLQSYLNDLKKEELKADFWPATPTSYILSKAAMNTYTKILAQRHPTFCINCVAPGFVKTDLNHHTGTSTVEEGAEGPIMLSLLPDGSPSGLFYEGKKVLSFE